MTNSEVSTSVISDDHMESVFIIIIIKKVKIIVTFSIKNTAGALYKSQIKGENRYCLWLRNSNVFRRRRKQSSDGAALTSAGRLFLCTHRVVS